MAGKSLLLLLKLLVLLNTEGLVVVVVSLANMESFELEPKVSPRDLLPTGRRYSDEPGPL